MLFILRNEQWKYLVWCADGSGNSEHGFWGDPVKDMFAPFLFDSEAKASRCADNRNCDVIIEQFVGA